MDNTTYKPSKTSLKTSFVLLAGLVLALATVVTPGAVHANPGNMCDSLADGLTVDPISGGNLEVVGVRKLFRVQQRPYNRVPTGAAITVMPKAGMTLADVQRAAVCHAGRSDAQSPLGVDNVKVRVEHSGSAYVVHITSDSRSGALEIQQRAQAAAQR